MASAHILERPGFRRRFRIIPEAHQVTAALEDDYHCMVVSLDHSDGAIISVQAEMERWPWTTCPGATNVIKSTFEGMLLADAARRGEKPANCTHLYDLVLLAAAHAEDGQAMEYDVFVTDPHEGSVEAKLHRDGILILGWELEQGIFSAPAELAGLNLFNMRSWIASLPMEDREGARILQWATLIAGGRSKPMGEQSDATRMPPNCYSFQPDMARKASRIGHVLEFSKGPGEPLDHFNGSGFGRQRRGGRVVWPIGNSRAEQGEAQCK